STPPAAHALPFRAARSLGPVDLEAAADGGGDGLQVVWVRGDHQVVTAHGSFHHARVDDVGGGGAAASEPTERACPSSRASKAHPASSRASRAWRPPPRH